MYEPLRIRAYLQCGVVSDATLPIDALLLYQACRERWGAQEYTVSGAGIYQREHGNLLPIKREHGVRWYYRASFAQWSQPVVEGQDHWNKRFDQSHAGLIDFDSKRGKVLINAGAYKAYHMPVYYLHALSVSWYVMGEADGVRRLLSMTTHLGKKTSQGWGRVLRWEVEPWPYDWSVYGPGGRLMRAVPASGGMLLAGYRPPYWDQHNQAMCLVPDGGYRSGDETIIR